jgi:hypothetical protein
MLLRLGLFAFAAIFGACAGAKTSTAPNNADQEWLVKLASEKVGERPTIEANQDASFSLCWNDKMNNNQIPALQFIIVRMSDHKVVEEGSVTMGEVRWTNDYEVEVSPREGQVQLARGPESNTRRINVKKYLDAIGR